MGNHERNPDGEGGNSLGSDTDATRSEDLKLGSEAQDAIGRRLRELYGEMLNTPVPDKFAQLLADLAKQEPKG